MGRGLLHLTVLSASDLLRHERLGKQHCYVEIHLGSGISRSKTCKDGGQHPVWNETLFFQLQNEQQIGFRVFAERLLMKDVEIGAATISLEQVMLNGADDAVLPLTHKGRPQGTLSISLELRSFNTTLHSRGSSGSPHSSASLAYSHSGSLGGSFTGPSGLKQSSLPILLMQQPNLALYREQLLQQSAVLAAQQQQQQQHMQRAAGLSRMSSGAGSSGGSGRHSAGDSFQQQQQHHHQQQQQRSVRWVPKKTPADLFPSPSASLQHPSDVPDLLGMLGAVESSTFSDFSSANSHGYAATQQPLDAQRVQALVDAVYGPGAGNVAAFGGGSSLSMGTSRGVGQSSTGLSSQAPATAAAAAATAAMRTKGMSGAGQAAAVGAARRSSAGESVSVSSVDLSGGSGSSRRSSRSGAAAAGGSRAAAAAAAGTEHAGGVFDPFGAATRHGAAAAAGTMASASPLRPVASQRLAASPAGRPGHPSSRPAQSATRRSSSSSSGSSSGSSSRRSSSSGGSSSSSRRSSKAADTAAGMVPQPPMHQDTAAAAGLQGGASRIGGSDMPDGFGLAAMQAAAAAFAAASGGALLLGSSTESSLQDPEAVLGEGDPFLAGVVVPSAAVQAAAAVQGGSSTGTTPGPAVAGTPAGSSSMPDPFGTYGVMQAAVAAAVLQGFDMPDPFGTGHRHAAEAAGAGPFRGEMPDPFAGPSAAAAAAAAAAGFADAAVDGGGSSSTASGAEVLEPAEPSIRPGEVGHSTSGRPASARSSRAGAVMLQTVIEVSESPSTSSLLLHSVNSSGSPVPSAAAAAAVGSQTGRPAAAQLGTRGGGSAAGQQQQQQQQQDAETAAAAGAPPAQQLPIGVQHLSGAISNKVTPAAASVEPPQAPAPSQEGSQPLQEQVLQLVKQLQERDEMVYQLQEQLKQVQQQLQSMKRDGH